MTHPPFSPNSVPRHRFHPITADDVEKILPHCDAPIALLLETTFHGG